MVQTHTTRILLFAVSCLGANWAWSDGRIELFSPSGYAKDVRQVTVRFSDAMVALGDPQRSDPFAVDCGVPGTGRWIDERNWVYDFDYDVPGALRCRFSPRGDVRTLAGEQIQALPEYAFHTGGPAIVDSRPRRGARIDERQVFLLALDAVAETNSIREHARCRIIESGTVVPVDVIRGGERTEILDALLADAPYLVEEVVESATSHLPSPDDPDTRRALERVVMVRCRDPLPAGSDVQFIWGAGIAAPNGAATTREDSLSYAVRPEFEAHLACKRSYEGRCVAGVHIQFTALVNQQLASRLRLVDEAGDVIAGEMARASQSRGYEYASLEVRDNGPIDRIDFDQASVDQASYRAELLAPITDIDGRPLANASSFPATIRLGSLPPGASFTSAGESVRVVERSTGGEAPVLLRHVAGTLNGRWLRVAEDHDIVAWIRRVESAREEVNDEWHGSAFEQSIFEIDEPGTPFTLTLGPSDRPTRTVGVPLSGPGFHVVELGLPAAGGLPRRYVAGSVVVTNLAVHVHRGRESSLVWVTRLSDGQPVEAADVAVTDACTGRTVARTTTDADGIGSIPGAIAWSAPCADFRYLVSARKNGDLAITTFGSRSDLEPQPNLVVHAVLDRVLYQPGDTVSMKLVARLATSDGLVVPSGLATGEVLIRRRWNESQSVTVDFADDGTALASFDLPASAKLGWYTVRFANNGKEGWIGRFRVERFRVGSMRANIDLPTGPLVNPGSVPVTLSVQHLVGGGAASLPVSVRSTVRPWQYSWEYREPAEPRTTSATLDSNGQAHLAVPVPVLERKGVLDVEMDYQDANGQRKTVSNRIELWPAAIELRVQSDHTRPEDKRILVKAQGLDGTAAKGVPIEARIYHPRHNENRRLAGGFRTVVRLAESPLVARCSGQTDATGMLACDVPPEAPNNVFVEATGWDQDGNPTHTTELTGLWNYARPQWLEVDSERAFAVGETVPIAVDLPFAEATVLVTVQREGVLAAFVEHVKGPKAVVNVPVQRNYAPRVAVSVLAVRARVGPKPTQRLGTPQPEQPGSTPTDDAPFRHDRAYIRIAPDAHTLSVVVDPGRDTYRTRDLVQVRIAVADPAGRPRPDAEVALVAVDEGLLDLWPNETWDILRAMMAERYARIDTSTSLRLSVAPLHLWTPAIETVIVTGSYTRPSGFGANPTDEDPAPREHFDSLLLWHARLAMDDEGTAEAEIPLNDLLTSFRIVAVATAGDDLFGTGEATIRTTQDLIVHAGLPEVVREGDRFDAVFTVRNASDTTRRIDVTARAEGLPELRPKRLRLRGGQTREMSWPVTVPAGVDGMHWEVSAKGRLAADRIVVGQTVQPSVPVRVQQATLTQLAARRELPVKASDKALPNRGGIRVSLLPSLADNLASVREAMARYRYSCVEQVVSAAVVLGDEVSWSAAMESARSSQDDDGLLRFFPSAALRGSPVLTAYVLTIADAAGKTVPDDFRESMAEGLEGYLAGRIVRASAFRAADSQLRRLSALAALARYGGIERATLDGAEVNAETLPTSALLDWIDILARVLPEDERLSVAKDALRVRLNLQGTTMGFTTERRDRLWWLMVGPDSNAARAILSVLDDPNWQAEVPRMVRGLFGRQTRGRWQTTVANAWGTAAAGAFRAAFETEPVTGASTVRLGEVRQQAVWPSPGDADGADLPQPIELPWSSAQTLALAHHGMGSPYGIVEFRAAVPLTEPTERGYRILRRVDAVDRKDARRWSRGDVAQVVLEIDADADMTWVVVEDPLPPGAVVLGSGLGDDSSILRQTHVRGDRWPVFTERGFDSYRAYYHYVPKGRTTLRYNVRYNTAGTFQLPPSRVEAMYAPDMHAELPVRPVTIR